MVDAKCLRCLDVVAHIESVLMQDIVSNQAQCMLDVITGKTSRMAETSIEVKKTIKSISIAIIIYLQSYTDTIYGKVPGIFRNKIFIRMRANKII